MKNVDDPGQGDHISEGTSTGIDLSAVPTILLAELNSASYQAKRSDSTLTAAKPEMEFLSQCCDSSSKDFKSRSVLLRLFEEGMRKTPEDYALIAILYTRTEEQLRFTWCLAGLTREEYDPEERKWSKVEKVFFMALRDRTTVSGIIGRAYNPFINDDISDC